MGWLTGIEPATTGRPAPGRPAAGTPAAGITTEMFMPMESGLQPKRCRNERNVVLLVLAKQSPGTAIPR